MDDHPDLRADLPALEPDPVLLARLVELSAAGSAAAAARAMRPVRALATGAAALGLVAGTTWIAGALPGVPTPLGPHRESRPAPTAPATTPGRVGDVRVPGSGLTSTSAPGAARPHATAPGGDLPPTPAETRSGPGEDRSGPAHPGRSSGLGHGARHGGGRHAGTGQGEGRGPVRAQGRGEARGQDRGQGAGPRRSAGDGAVRPGDAVHPAPRGRGGQDRGTGPANGREPSIDS